MPTSRPLPYPPSTPSPEGCEFGAHGFAWVCMCTGGVLIQINPTMNHSCMYFHGLYNLSLFLALIHESFYPFTDCVGLLRLIHNGMSTRGRSSCWDCEAEGSGATAPETVLQALTKVRTRADDRADRTWIRHELAAVNNRST